MNSVLIPKESVEVALDMVYMQDILAREKALPEIGKLDDKKSSKTDG